MPAPFSVKEWDDASKTARLKFLQNFVEKYLSNGEVFDVFGIQRDYNDSISLILTRLFAALEIALRTSDIFGIICTVASGLIMTSVGKDCALESPLLLPTFLRALLCSNPRREKDVHASIHAIRRIVNMDPDLKKFAVEECCVEWAAGVLINFPTAPELHISSSSLILDLVTISPIAHKKFSDALRSLLLCRYIQVKQAAVLLITTCISTRTDTRIELDCFLDIFQSQIARLLISGPLSTQYVVAELCSRVITSDYSRTLFTDSSATEEPTQTLKGDINQIEPQSIYATASVIPHPPSSPMNYSDNARSSLKHRQVMTNSPLQQNTSTSSRGGIPGSELEDQKKSYRHHKSLHRRLVEWIVKLCRSCLLLRYTVGGKVILEPPVGWEYNIPRDAADYAKLIKSKDNKGVHKLTSSENENSSSTKGVINCDVREVLELISCSVLQPALSCQTQVPMEASVTHSIMSALAGGGGVCVKQRLHLVLFYQMLWYLRERYTKQVVVARWGKTAQTKQESESGTQNSTNTAASTPSIAQDKKSRNSGDSNNSSGNSIAPKLARRWLNSIRSKNSQDENKEKESSSVTSTAKESDIPKLVIRLPRGDSKSESKSNVANVGSGVDNGAELSCWGCLRLLDEWSRGCVTVQEDMRTELLHLGELAGLRIEPKDASEIRRNVQANGKNNHIGTNNWLVHSNGLLVISKSLDVIAAAAESRSCFREVLGSGSETIRRMTSRLNGVQAVRMIKDLLSSSVKQEDAEDARLEAIAKAQKKSNSQSCQGEGSIDSSALDSGGLGFEASLSIAETAITSTTGYTGTNTATNNADKNGWNDTSYNDRVKVSGGDSTAADSRRGSQFTSQVCDISTMKCKAIRRNTQMKLQMQSESLSRANGGNGKDSISNGKPEYSKREDDENDNEKFVVSPRVLRNKQGVLHLAPDAMQNRHKIPPNMDPSIEVDSYDQIQSGNYNKNGIVLNNTVTSPVSVGANGKVEQSRSMCVDNSVSTSSSAIVSKSTLPGVHCNSADIGAEKKHMIGSSINSNHNHVNSYGDSRSSLGGRIRSFSQRRDSSMHIREMGGKEQKHGLVISDSARKLSKSNAIGHNASKEISEGVALGGGLEEGSASDSSDTDSGNDKGPTRRNNASNHAPAGSLVPLTPQAALRKSILASKSNATTTQQNVNVSGNSYLEPSTGGLVANAENTSSVYHGVSKDSHKSDDDTSVNSFSIYRAVSVSIDGVEGATGMNGPKSPPPIPHIPTAPPPRDSTMSPPPSNRRSGRTHIKRYSTERLELSRDASGSKSGASIVILRNSSMDRSEPPDVITMKSEEPELERVSVYADASQIKEAEVGRQRRHKTIMMERNMGDEGLKQESSAQRSNASNSSKNDLSRNQERGPGEIMKLPISPVTTRILMAT